MEKPEEKTDEQITASSLFILSPTIKKNITVMGSGTLTGSRPVINWKQIASDIDKAGYKLVKK